MSSDAQRLHLLNAWRDLPSSLSYTGQRILLTGARGQVGLCALHHWLAAGTEVVALTRQEPLAYSHPGLHWVHGNLAVPESLETIAAPFPSMVVFTAPIWFLPPLMALFKRRGVRRVIAFSSTSIHSKKESGKTKERDLAMRLATSEQAVFEAGARDGIAVTILRPTLIYGIGLDQNVTSLARVIKRLPIVPIPLHANGLRQPVHTDDLAIATLQVVSAPATYGKAYDVGGGETLTYRAMLSRIATVIGKRPFFLPVPGFAAMLDLVGLVLRGRVHGEIVRRMQQDLAFDSSAARADFGWNPRNFLDATRQPPHTAFF
jgi:nucleoside-diphosphate-sugar epimerase